VIAYGICIGTEEKYARLGAPGLAKFAAESPVLLRRQQRSIFEAYNSMIDEALEIPDIEGIVLIHEDVELRAPIEETLRGEFATSDVAIVGTIGGRGINSVRWYRSDELVGYAADSFYGANDHGQGFFDVDTVDGLLLAMSPAGMRQLRFDSDTFTGFHAYDADICMQARRGGLRVRVAPLDVFHHTKGGFGDAAQHRRIDDAFRDKWGIPRDRFPHRIRKKLLKKVY
jgi:hypothetical protein